jgi:4-hydroxymandelate oxidase
VTSPTADPSRIVRVADFEPLARAWLDPAAYDYIAGGSWDEITLAENEAAWLRRRFRPRVLVDVSSVSTATTMAGAPTALPLAIAPMSVHELAHPEAELATVRAAASAGVPFTLSTMASRSIEDVAAAAPDAIRWFQLYLQQDRDVSRSFVERAATAGYRAIVLTVDLPVMGYRERDLRNGFDLPDLGNFQAGAPSHRPLRTSDPGPVGGPAAPSPTWHDIASIRSWSSLPLVLKGILTSEDAKLAI